MFNFFKKKDKDKNSKNSGSVSVEDTWGGPVRPDRKLTKEEIAEQMMVEEKNLERRTTYRPAGIERIFNDLQGRRLAIRTELNLEHPTFEHPPLVVMVFWGAKEVGHIHAQVDGAVVRVTDCKTESGFEGRGVSAELLAEVERVAREQNWREVCCPPVVESKLDWNGAFYTGQGYTSRDNLMLKTL